MTFDTLSYARRLRQAGVPEAQAEAMADATRELVMQDIATGEAAMCHSLANIEHHHFKFDAHRRPGDVHAHYFGAHSLSAQWTLVISLAAGAGLAHCPTSNLFLGSGAFDLFAARRADRPVAVGLGTDIGAGTSLSSLVTLGEAHKVARMHGRTLDAARALWLATLGGAAALGLADRVGNVAPGLEADLVVLDPRATPLLAARTGQAGSIEEILFLLMTLGDDRVVRATYAAGTRVHERPAGPGAAPVPGSAPA